MTSVFLSYSRSDDEKFVRRLRDDLAGAGLSVWFDRISMPSRQLTFYQEIRDAIEGCDRLVLIVGPGAAASDYVNQEWRFAYLEALKCVIPIVRLDGSNAEGSPVGGYALIPEELRLMHAEDFRGDASYPEHLTNLIRQLSEELPRAGTLVSIPELPAHFVAQADRIKALRDILLADLLRPVVVTGAAGRLGLHGMGGIGKSVLANALARGVEVRRAFPDGLYWVTVGQEPQLETLQSSLLTALGAEGAVASVEAGKQRLREALAGRSALLILDDVWERAHAEAFNVTTGRSRLLLTTRDAALVTALAAGENHFQVQLPSQGEAEAMLRDAAGLVEMTSEARAVIEECGRLPLALALCGGMMKASVSTRYILEALRERDLSYISTDNAAYEQHRDLWRAMALSVRMLTDEHRRRFIELAVFAPDRGAPEGAAAVLWAHTGSLSPRQSNKLLAELRLRSLVEFSPAVPGQPGRLAVHDLIHKFAGDLVSKEWTGGFKFLHEQLVDSYAGMCADGWPSGPNDGYFFENICEHLNAAGRVDAAVALIADLRWIEAKCRLKLVESLQEDYRGTVRVLPEAKEELETERVREARLQRWTEELTEYARGWSALRARAKRNEPLLGPGPTLPVPPSAIRPLTDAEIDSRRQAIRRNLTRFDVLKALSRFVEQEFGALYRFGDRAGFVVQHAANHAGAGPVHEAGKRLREAIQATSLWRRWPAGSDWIPDPALLRIIEQNVYATAATPDLRWAVTLTWKTLHKWDLRSGTVRSIPAGEQNGHSVAITPDARFAVIGCEAGPVELWDLDSGTCLRTVGEARTWDEDYGNPYEIVSVSVTPDARLAIAGHRDGSARLWDLGTGQCLLFWKCPGAWCKPLVAISPDGRRVVLERAHELHIVDVATRKRIRYIEDDGGIDCLSVTPDLRRAVSGGSSRDLQVWDLERGASVRTLKACGAVQAVCLTPDGTLAASASFSGWPGAHLTAPKALHVWNVETGECFRSLIGHSDELRSLAISADGRRALSAASDNTMRVWNLERGHSDTVLGTGSSVNRLELACSGSRVVAEIWNSDTLQLWDVDKGVQVGELGGHKCPQLSVAREAPVAISGGEHGALRVWDLDSGAVVQTVECKTWYMHAVAVTADGRRAITSDKDHLRMWSLRTGTCLRKAKRGKPAKTIRFAAGSRLALIEEDYGGGLIVWDLKTFKCRHTLLNDAIRVRYIELSEDGRRAFAVTAAESVETRDSAWVWDLETGDCLHKLDCQSWHSHWAATTDGRYAVSVGPEIHVWNLESGQLERYLENHFDFGFVLGGSHTLSACMSPDGRYAFCAYANRCVAVSDLRRSECVALALTDAPVTEMLLRNDVIVIGTKLGQVQFFDVRNLLPA